VGVVDGWFVTCQWGYPIYPCGLRLDRPSCGQAPLQVQAIETQDKCDNSLLRLVATNSGIIRENYRMIMVPCHTIILPLPVGPSFLSQHPKHQKSQDMDLPYLKRAWKEIKQSDENDVP